ncbi:Maf-like protein [Croceibacter atlanticus]|uniref:Maf-like protein n=1 Tax=Croceibacter atlanticus TaxID=313588 RepID=UPI002E143AAF|nr:Maf-like protein [Croceibacter atlanticus]
MLQDHLKDFNLILASGSPRRQQYFKELQLDFTVQLKPVEEIYPSELKGVAITDYLAELKASAFKDLNDNDILVTSDTIVWFEGEALGKPKSPEQAKEMISKMSGKSHEVMTSICFTQKHQSKTVNYTTKVTFNPISQEAISYYVDTFKPMDKAGAYGIQEWIGLIAIKSIEGSYPNVVGMPMHLVYEELMTIAASTH